MHSKSYAPSITKRRKVEKKICPRKKLDYEITYEEMREQVARKVTEHFKPKVSEKRVPVDPEVAAAEVYACLNNPPGPKTTLKLRPYADKCPPEN